MRIEYAESISLTIL